MFCKIRLDFPTGLVYNISTNAYTRIINTIIFKKGFLTMNTRNRITLLLAAIIAVALLVVGMTLTTSAAEGDLVTEYGVVPAANANDNFAYAKMAA